ncbi:hypothetical protein [Bacillus sp. Brlt_9]|uniref:hypothetical protein n=1 Tax=Bacillus sp. Brlt_9 TaxID=3110916 RepID=UPI003F7BF21E
MTKTMKFITNGYTYENLLTDACYYAIGGTGSLKMGVNDLMEGFQLSFDTEESFDEVLTHYDKSYTDFISDVIKTFKDKMRAIRKEKNLKASMNETNIKSPELVNSNSIYTSTPTEHTYENLLMDACGPAIKGLAGLSTGLYEVMNDYQCLYGTDETFEMALKRYNKTLVEFKQDVVTRYKIEKRALRKSQKSEMTYQDSLASNHTTTTKDIIFTNDFEREIEEEITSVFGVQTLDPKTIEHEQIIENELQKMFQPVCNNKNITAVQVITDSNKSESKQHKTKEVVTEQLEPTAHINKQEESDKDATSQEQICLDEFIPNDNTSEEKIDRPKDIISLDKKKEIVSTPKITSNTDSTELTLDKLAHLISSKVIKTKDDFESIINEKWQYKSGKNSKLLFSIVKICKIKENGKTIGFDNKKMASLFKSLLLEPYKKQKEAC